MLLATRQPGTFFRWFSVPVYTDMPMQALLDVSSNSLMTLKLLNSSAVKEYIVCNYAITYIFAYMLSWINLFLFDICVSCVP